MRIVRYRNNGTDKFGILEGERILPTSAGSLQEALAAKPGSGEGIALDAATLLAPVARPGKILGIGVNYAAHAAESVSFVDTSSQVQKWFNKQATAVNAPFGQVHLPRVSDQLDYEVELVVVIGRAGRHVPRERAMDIVAGFCAGCDYSVRDWQKASQTMIMGKGFDTHAPFGPAIVTPDEIDDLAGLELRSFVNGELRQQGHVRDMIHDIPAQIAHLTAAFTLEPGDLIFTGTPAGVGAAHDPPKWLKAGDRVRIEIDQVGSFENEIVREPDDTVRY